MYDHIGLQVNDLDASVRFYAAALEPLGMGLCTRDNASASFGPRDAPSLYLYAASNTPGAAAHVALRAPDRAAVRRFHACGLIAGGQDHGAPGLRADYAPTYYAAFLRDPDGNNIEAVCMSAS